MYSTITEDCDVRSVLDNHVMSHVNDVSEICYVRDACMSTITISYHINTSMFYCIRMSLRQYVMPICIYTYCVTIKGAEVFHLLFPYKNPSGPLSVTLKQF
jgi:hypothetical protein